MEEIKLDNWEAFEGHLEKDLKKSKPSSDALFRGHSNTNWKLETTLERFSNKRTGLSKEYSWEDYNEILGSINPTILSLTHQKFEFENYRSRHDQVPAPPPNYDFMIYLRHHGFPSPLLDWTRSPYVAAFFAFNEPTESENVAIFSFRETLDGYKYSLTTVPHIIKIGHKAGSNRRHIQQKSEYTICFKQDSGKHFYCYHEEVEYGDKQDILKKYLIPSKERKKALEKLYFRDINAYSLFGSEESLMSKLAYQEIERKR